MNQQQINKLKGPNYPAPRFTPTNYPNTDFARDYARTYQPQSQLLRELANKSAPPVIPTPNYGQKGKDYDFQVRKAIDIDAAKQHNDYTAYQEAFARATNADETDKISRNLYINSKYQISYIPGHIKFNLLDQKQNAYSYNLTSLMFSYYPNNVYAISLGYIELPNIPGLFDYGEIYLNLSPFDVASYQDGLGHNHMFTLYQPRDSINSPNIRIRLMPNEPIYHLDALLRKVNSILDIQLSNILGPLTLPQDVYTNCQIVANTNPAQIVVANNTINTGQLIQVFAYDDTTNMAISYYINKDTNYVATQVSNQIITIPIDLTGVTNLGNNNFRIVVVDNLVTGTVVFKCYGELPK